MKKMNINVNYQKLFLPNKQFVVELSKNYLEVQFNFLNDDWNNCDLIIAILKNTNGEITKEVLDNNNSIIVKKQVLIGGYFEVSLCGYNHILNQEIPTDVLTVPVNNSLKANESDVEETTYDKIDKSLVKARLDEFSRLVFTRNNGEEVIIEVDGGSSHFKGYFTSKENLPKLDLNEGDYAFVGDTKEKNSQFIMYIWDAINLNWEETISEQYVLNNVFDDFKQKLTNGEFYVGSIQGNVKNTSSNSPTLKNLRINGVDFLIPDNKNIDLVFSEEHIEGAKSLSSIKFNGETWNVVGSGGGVVDEILLTSITPDNIISTKSEDIVLNYLFERENDTTKSGIEKIFVNGALKSTRSISQGNIYSDITKLLSDNANTVEVQVTSSGITASLIYNIEIIELSISSNFDGFGIYQSNFTYRYTPIGNVSKTIHFILDGVEKTTVVNENNKVMSYEFTGLTHGTHKLNVYATANVGEKNIKSNTLKYSLAVNTGEDKTIIACPFDIEECKQGELLTFNYVVCDPNSLTAPVTIYVNNEVVSELIVDRTKQTWSTRNYPAGQTTFKIISNDAEFEAIVNVEASEIVIEPITHDLELYLTANGRSNNEAADVRGIWTNNNVESVLSNFNWKSNGWVLDKNGDTALRINNGANVYIPLKIFEKDFRETGKVIEFEFATRDILDYDSILISCENGGRGFTLSSSVAMFASEQTTIITKFKEDEKIRLSFVVEPINENCLVYTYVNGIISGLAQYPNDDDFTQNNPVGISIGSKDATIDIYNIRVYNIDLDYKDVLTNYIADTQDTETKLNLYKRNDVFDSFGNINYQKVLQQIPCLTIIGELPGSKGDKKTVTIEYKNNADNTKNFKQYNSTIDIQGTSSQYYPRKNYKFKLESDYQLTNDSIPEKVFCIKADFMESSHSHNTGLAKIVNKLYPTTPPKENNTQVQAAITGFPIVVWHKENENSASNCLGVYNFNNDKDDVNTFGYTLSFPNCESWEFKNNTSAHCLFQNDNFVDKVEVAKNFEARYPEKYTNYDALSRVVSWVYSTRNDLNKFKNEFEQYFNKEATLLYYCLTEVFAMVDSRAKNLFLTTWNGLIWYPTFYDMDTAFGLNNEGVNDFSYNVEYHDTKGSQNVFNGESSVLWNNFEQVFADDITEFYNDLRNNKLLTYDSVMNVLYGEQISKICESNYNYDAIEKYRDPLLETGENKLFVAQGSRLDHLKWWLFNRLNYMDSKYVASDFKENYMTLRIYTPETYGSIVPNADITITPYADQYVQVKYDENAFSDRGTHDESVTIEAPKQVFNDTPLIIYGASRISDIGDLSPLYAGTVDVAKGVKLKKLIVGNKAGDYSNTNLKELTVGNNELLKVLDVRNCPSLTNAIDVSGCTGIEEIYATGTSTTAVKLPNGGNVKKLHLPDTITNLTILNQLFIEEFVYSSLSNVSTLHIENSNVDKLSIVQQAKGNLARVRLLNVDWSLDNKELLDYLMTCKGIGDTGLNIDKSVLTGKVHINGSISQQDLDAYNSYWGATNLVVTADEIAIHYTATFVDYEGNVLYETSVKEGEKAAYIGTTPTKPTDDVLQEKYTFSSWSPNIDTPLYENTTFTPVFNVTKYWVVEFVNWDGTTLQTSYVDNGGSVEYTGKTPTRPDTEDGYIYTFNGWDKTLTNVTSNMVVTAQYFSDKPTIFTLNLTDSANLQPTVSTMGFKNSSITVDWGDGTTETVVPTVGSMNITKAAPYLATGEYTIKVLIHNIVTIDLTPMRYVAFETGYSPYTYRQRITKCEYQEGVCTFIYQYTFSNAKDLTIVKLPNGITTIGDSAFASCDSLSNLTIPESVTVIARLALKIGSSNNKATIIFEGETPPTIYQGTFDTSKLQEIRVPASAVKTYKSATNWSAFADYIVGYEEE